MISKGIKWYKNYKYNKFVDETVLVQKNEKIKLTEEEKNQDWNNDGISNKEALDLNLNISVSDSDGDGLSDSDEINIYKSNPLRYSTSGDIYSDGYKIKFSYNIDMKYETYKTLDTTNSKLKLEANDAYDLNAYYKEYAGTIPSGYYLGVQPFRVFSFDGEVNLEIENPNDFEVVSYNTVERKAKKIKSRVENEYLVFEIKDDNPILVVYKEKVLKKMDANVQSMINSKYKNNVAREYYILAYPLLNVLKAVPVYVMEVNNAKAGMDSDYDLVDRLNSRAQGVFTIQHSYINTISVNIMDEFLGKIVGEASSYLGEENKGFINIAIMYKHVYSDNELYEFLYGVFDESNDGTNTDSNSQNDDSLTENSQNEDGIDNISLQKEYDKKYSNMNCEFCADSGFKVNVNAFPFENLSTTIGPNGVCAGFSYLTTGVYNNFSIPRKKEGIYDLTASIYDTIWNKRLYQQSLGKELSLYADNVASNHNKLNSQKLEKPDSEIVKALEHYYQEFNDDIRMSKVNWAFNNAREVQTFIDDKTIDNLVSQFRSGKIVSVVLLGDGQHAINAYKIAEDVYDPDILYIKAYDNNLPNDKFWNKDYTKQVKQDVTITLKRVYEDNWTGTKVKYVYNYAPIAGTNYKYSSFNGGLDSILFIDEYGNVL